MQFLSTMSFRAFLRPINATILIILLFLTPIFGSAQDNTLPADSLINRGHMLVRQGERELGLDTLFYALEQYDRNSEVRDYFDVLTALTFHLYYTDTYGEFYPLDERLKYIDEAIKLAIELKEDSIYTNKIYHKGVLYNITESIDSALYFFDKTIEWTGKIGNENLMLQAYYFKSGILRDRGDLEASYYLLLEYEKEAERIGNGIHIQTALQALGTFFVTQGDNDKSILYYKKSLEAARKYDMDAYYSLASLATSYMDADSIELARQYLKESEEEVERIKRVDEFDQGYGFKKMSVKKTQGYFYSAKLADYDSALLYYQEALQLAEDLAHKESMAETRENIAQVYDRTGSPEKALLARQKNYDLVKEVINLKLQIQIEENMAYNYEELGRFEEAIDHFKNYQNLSDSLLNIEQLEAVARLETEYETEKQAQQIALLNEQTQRQQSRQNGLLIIGALLLIILLVVILALRGKHRANQLITSQKQALESSNKKLTELGEFKENLTHMIVHDMKNPLNAVIGLSKGEASQKKLHTIGQSGQQMLNMVSNMLDVQKFEEAKVSLNTQPHSFQQLLKEATIYLELLMHAKNITLELNIDPRVSVDVDSELVVRILGNLLSNAIKFSELGGVIKVEAKMSKNEQLLLVSITDHGAGLEGDQLKQVFNKYWQGARHAGYSSSSGLGLTFCKLAVEAHGGSIMVDSKPGEFTTFSFSLPVAEVSETDLVDLPEALEREESLILESDIAVLSKYISELGNLKVHQVGKINNIIRQLDEEEVKSPWKTDLVSAMHQGNQARFDELVAMLQ